MARDNVEYEMSSASSMRTGRYLRLHFEMENVQSITFLEEKVS